MTDMKLALGYAATCVCGSEGFAKTAYLDKLARVPVWTIGYGTTRINGEPVREGMTCTHDQALAWAAADMQAAANFVRRAVSVELNDWQLAALISFCYNIGMGNFARSSVRAALNAGCYACAAEKLLEYDEAGGHVIGGLETRRKRERALFLIGNGNIAFHTCPAAPAAACGIDPDNEADLLNQQELDRLHHQGDPA